MHIHIDFETRSALDLTVVGPVVYARHPTTEALCLSWRTKPEKGLWISETTPGDYVPPRRQFNPASLARLFQLILNRNNTVEAHNAMFEKCIWQFICQGQLGWPEVAPQQWRCSAVKAAVCALPRALIDAGHALKLPHIKDEEARRTMLKLAKFGAKGTPEEWERLYDYCENDTLAEMTLSDALPELSPKELKVWQIDQEMNRKGIPCDVEGAKKVLGLISAWVEELNMELAILTDFAVTKATQRGRLKAWLSDKEGIHLWSTKAEVLDPLFESGFFDKSPKGKRAIEILRSIGRSSTAKYETLIVSSIDDLIHDTLLYHGPTTGRWSAKRFQPQNLPRGRFKKKQMELAWQFIHSENLDMLRLLYGEPMEFFSHVLRGVLRAIDGQKLFCGDYASIETCVLFWLADDFEALKILANPLLDIYLDMASDIYGKKKTKDDDDARQLGKRAILGLGFGMGFIKFLMTCHTYKMYFKQDVIDGIMSTQDQTIIAQWLTSEKQWNRVLDSGFNEKDFPELVLMKFIVDRYRAKYSDTVCAMWDAVEKAAKAAIKNPGKVFRAGKCRWLYAEKFNNYGSKFLICQLPSGRPLFYPFPALDREGITFMGVDSKTHQWVRERTYGAKLCENITQATARDVMVEGMLRADAHPYFNDLRATVHDELVAMSDKGTAEEFNDLIAIAPDWARDMPVRAESWSGVRYRK